MYVEEVKISQRSKGCSLKEGNDVSSCKGLMCVCKKSHHCENKMISALRGSRCGSLEH